MMGFLPIFVIPERWPPLVADDRSEQRIESFLSICVPRKIADRSCPRAITWTPPRYFATPFANREAANRGLASPPLD
jgi:hypothetical protein